MDSTSKDTQTNSQNDREEIPGHDEYASIN